MPRRLKRGFRSGATQYSTFYKSTAFSRGTGEGVGSIPLFGARHRRNQLCRLNYSRGSSSSAAGGSNMPHHRFSCASVTLNP
jgi:hypothetical protein